MSFPMSILRMFLVVVWLVISCVAGLAMCLAHWGNPSLNRWFGRTFAWGALRICGFQVSVEGLERLEARQPCVYVANHQSGLDMAVFGWVYPRRTVVVGKRELLWIPFFGLFFKAAGNIVLDREKRVRAIAGLKAVAEDIRRRQVSVWVFPEGTRNRTDEVMVPFKKGAFYMALQAGVPIVPVVCSPLKEFVDWRVRMLKPGRVRVRVMPPVETSSYGEREVDRLTQDVEAKMHEAIRSLA